MAEPKTKQTKVSVAAFLAGVEDVTRRTDAKAIDKLFRAITGEKPAMWGPTIIGYGSYATSTGTWPRIGFSPRGANLVLYVLSDYAGREALLKKLGKHKTGKTCLYVTKLADVDGDVLRELVTRCWNHMNATHA